MPPRDRLVLTLRYLDQCDVAETARRTGWTRTMVKVQTLRARNKLRKLIESEWCGVHPMNWEQKIERLAAQARAEPSPRVDVAQSVLRTAHGRTGPASDGMTERFWMWLAAASSAVAVPAAAIAFILYARSVEPLSEIAEAISWAIQ